MSISDKTKKALEKIGLTSYEIRTFSALLKAGVKLTEEGQAVGASMMRNSRVLEVLMESKLKVDIDEEMICGIEHHMNTQFTDALCTMLNHPRKCPHDHEIPMGECCKSI